MILHNLFISCERARKGEMVHHCNALETVAQVTADRNKTMHLMKKSEKMTDTNINTLV